MPADAGTGATVRRAWLLVLAAVACAWPAGAARAEQMSEQRQREVLRAALGAFDEAVSTAQRNPGAAAELYRKSAAGFEALADAGLRNAAIEYNLGNAYFRLGQFGRAVVHYRRALREEPADKELLANLDYARRQVEPLIRPTGQERLWHRLLFWHHRTSLSARVVAAGLLSAFGWLLLILRLRWPKRPLLVVGVVSVVLGLAAGTSVVWQVNDEAERPHAVVVGDDCILRLGRGEGYDPALKQPLGPGVELRILQQRGDWVEVILLNDQTGWLPASAIERV